MGQKIKENQILNTVNYCRSSGMVNSCSTIDFKAVMMIHIKQRLSGLEILEKNYTKC